MNTSDTSKNLGNGVEDAMRGFWSTRPQRPQGGRKVAGVAAAIGNRYAIDPTLVRVAFIVGTLFGGSGLVAYLLGWLFLANEGDEVSAFESMINRGQSSVSSGFSVLLCLALIPTTSGLLGGGFLFGNGLTGALGFAALIVGVYLLHRGRTNLGIAGQPPAAPAAESTGGGLSQVLGQMFHQQAGPTTAEKAPDWDPLGAAPFAWDLPEPNQAPPPPPPDSGRRPPKARHNSKANAAGFFAALIALIVCVLAAPDVSWLTAGHIIGIVLGTLALSMIIGSFRGGGRGLIGLAIILSVGGLAVSTAGDYDLNSPKGDFDLTPTSLNQVQQNYSGSFGDLTLDLTKLPNSGTVNTSVTNKFGAAKVILPPNADVNLYCDTKFGSADCLGHEASGASKNTGKFSDDGTDGKGGLVVNLNASSKFGNLEVIRG